MKEHQDYIQDIAEIRSMMERSTKFLSLSGLSGIMAGLYALAGAWIAWYFYSFNPDEIYSTLDPGSLSTPLPSIIILASVILIAALGTAVLLSRRNAKKEGKKVWAATSRRLLGTMAVPLVSGGIFLILLGAEGLVGLLAPVSMIFYGLAIYNGSKFTYQEMKFMGLIQIGLGLAGCWFVEYGVLLWAIGFGVVHIIYGIYMHFRYER